MKITLRVLGVMVLLLVGALPGAAAPAAPEAPAVTCTWTNPTGGSCTDCFFDWATAGNWDCGHVPGSADAAVITLSSTKTNYTIDVKSSVPVVGSLSITTSGTALFNLRISNGATLTVSGACSANKTSGGNLWITAGANSGSGDSNGTLYCQGAASFGTSGVASVILRNATNTGTFRFDGDWTTGAYASIPTDATAPDLFLLSGAGNQTVTFNSAQTLAALQINKSSAAAVATVAGSQEATVNALTLSQGLLKLSKNLNISAGGGISGGSVNSMVVTDTDGSAAGDGYLCKQYSTGTGDPDGAGFTFPVGDASGTAQYTPAMYNFTSSTTRGTSAAICVKVTDSTYGNIPSNRASYLSRYWSVYASNITFTSNPAVSFKYADTVAGDDVTLVSPAAEGSIKYQYSTNSGTTWNQGAGTDAGNNLLSGTVGTLGTSGTPAIHTGFSQSPTAVTLESMAAVAAPEGGRIDVTWTTAQETDNRGFNLWRGTSPAGPDVRLNAAVIPSQAPGQGMGADYAYADTYELIAGTTYYYWLEDVSLSGTVTRHEPVSVTYLGPTAVTLSSLSAGAGPGPVVTTSVVIFAALVLAALAGVAGVVRRRVGMEAHDA